MNRRTLLAASALLPFAGCSLAGTTPAQWATDLSLIASWMPNITSALGAMGTKISAATLAQVNTLAAEVQKDATAVATATANVVAGTSAATYVQEAVTALEAIAGVVMPLFPASSPVLPIVEAILSLVPEIAAAAGLTAATVTPMAFTPAQARALLAVK